MLRVDYTHYKKLQQQNRQVPTSTLTTFVVCSIFSYIVCPHLTLTVWGARKAYAILHLCRVGQHISGALYSLIDGNGERGLCSGEGRNSSTRKVAWETKSKQTNKNAQKKVYGVHIKYFHGKPRKQVPCIWEPSRGISISEAVPQILAMEMKIKA